MTKVRSDRLSCANGKIWALDTLGRSLAGPPVGAALFAWVAALPFGLDGASFLASALLLIGLPAGRPDNPPGEPILTSVRAGMAYLVRSTQLRMLALGMASYNAYNVAFATLVLFAWDVM